MTAVRELEAAEKMVTGKQSREAHAIAVADDPAQPMFAEGSRAGSYEEGPARVTLAVESKGVNATGGSTQLRAAEESRGVNIAVGSEYSRMTGNSNFKSNDVVGDDRSGSYTEEESRRRGTKGNSGDAATLGKGNGVDRSDKMREGRGRSGDSRANSSDAAAVAAAAAAKTRPIFVTVILRVDEQEHRVRDCVLYSSHTQK